MWAQQVTSEEVSRALETVTEREELRALYEPESSYVPGWLRRLGDYFDSKSAQGPSEDPFDPSGGGVSGFLDAMPYLVSGVVLVLVAAAVIYFLLRLRRDEGARTKREELRTSRVASQLEAGRAARLAGDLPTALRAFWAALVTGLGRGDELVYRPAWTCREMLSRSRTAGPDTQLLSELLPRIERLEFGRVEITLADVEDLERLCDERLAPVLRLEGATR